MYAFRDPTRFPGVVFDEQANRKDIDFKIVPIAKTTPPNGAGTGEDQKPPGNNGDGDGGKSGSNGARRSGAKAPKDG